MRSGNVAVVGRPNVGKSTLVNALVGFKVSIISSKPQTTRHRILGIATREHAQFVFIDTPGMHAAEGRAINRYLNRAARGSLSEADVIVLVVEASRWLDEDQHALDAAREAGAPIVLVLNKIDRIERAEQLLPILGERGKLHDFAAIVPISAEKKRGLDALERAIAPLLPEQEPQFEADDVTDRSERFLAGELVREQVVRQLRDELPHATTVELEKFERDGELLHIAATIMVERDGQKAIVVGAGGEQIKRIGIAARRELEKLFDTKVHLQLWVRVRAGWSDDERALRQFGYGD
jgi:GTPase